MRVHRLSAAFFLVLVAGCAGEAEVIRAAPATPASREAAPVAGGRGGLDDFAPDDPYPAKSTYVSVAGRTDKVAVDPACRGGVGLRFLAVIATGPQDDTERLRVEEGTICRDVLSLSRTALPAGSWARTARNFYVSVRRSADATDQVVVVRGGQVQPLVPEQGHSTYIPTAYDDGAVAVAVADDRGVRVELLRRGKSPATLMTSPSSISGFDYTPSGSKFVGLDRLGVPGAFTGSRLSVADAAGTRQHSLASPFAASIVVLDEQRAVVGDITDRPGGGSVMVDLATGALRPLAVGLFPLAYDRARDRLLMRNAAGALAWLSPQGGSVSPVAVPAGLRVVGGDFLR